MESVCECSYPDPSWKTFLEEYYWWGALISGILMVGALYWDWRKSPGVNTFLEYLVVWGAGTFGWPAWLLVIAGLLTVKAYETLWSLCVEMFGWVKRQAKSYFSS